MEALEAFHRRVRQCPGAASSPSTKGNTAGRERTLKGDCGFCGGGRQHPKIRKHKATDGERREPSWHLPFLPAPRDIMKICGACERDLPDGSYSKEQRGLRQSSRRCEECVASGNQLVLMKKGRKRSEEDDCPICSLPLPLVTRQSSFRVCCIEKVCNGCVLAAQKSGMKDCPFCRAPMPKKSQILAMLKNE